MSRRAPVLAALALSFTSAAAPVQTPCDVVPPSVGPALCQPCPGGPPVPGARVAGVGLDYVDQWHAQCELYRNDRGIGQCKNNTTCLPGWEKFQDGGVWKCRQPATGKMRDDCERNLPLSISEVHDDRDLNNPTLHPGPNFLFVRGSGAANATSGEMTGGIVVTVGEAARRVGSSTVCLPPNCQDVRLQVPPGAVGSNQTLKLYTPHQYKSATASLYVSLPATAAVGRAGVGGRIGAPVANQQPRDQSYSAGLGCPGGQTSSTNVFQSGGPSQVFEVRNPQGVQATAGAQWSNTRSAQGAPICTWEGAYQFVIKALDGQGDVTVSWTPQHSGNYFNPLTLSMTRSVTLAKGRWQIVPDATFPPDFTYTISYRD